MPSQGFRDLFAGPVAATAGLGVPLLILERRLRATGGPGIIPFELAGPQRTEEILALWGEQGRTQATWSLLLDFPFLVAYTTLGARLTTRLAERAGVPPWLRGAAPAIRAVQVAAGRCDAIENAALLVVVRRRGDATCATVARRAALVKFAGLGVGSGYAAAALARR